MARYTSEDISNDFDRRRKRVNYNKCGVDGCGLTFRTKKELKIHKFLVHSY